MLHKTHCLLVCELSLLLVRLVYILEVDVPWSESLAFELVFLAFLDIHDLQSQTVRQKPFSFCRVNGLILSKPSAERHVLELGNHDVINHILGTLVAVGVGCKLLSNFKLERRGPNATGLHDATNGLPGLLDLENGTTVPSVELLLIGFYELIRHVVLVHDREVDQIQIILNWLLGQVLGSQVPIELAVKHSLAGVCSKSTL